MFKGFLPGRRIFFLGLLLLFLGALAWHFEAASRFDPAALDPEPGPIVLDRSGRMLRLVPDAEGRKLLKSPDPRIPRVLAAAFVAAEDQRFWRHPGIDPLAILRALGSNLASGRIVSGASTITQQLVRLSYPGPRTYYGKLVEMLRALRVEQALSKEEILRHYLDRVPLGNNLLGVETAAQAYFGKKGAQLTVGEAALLASLAKAPGKLNPYGRNRSRLLARQQWVLGRMARLGALSAQELQAAREDPVTFRGGGGRAPSFPFEAPHWVNLVLAGQPPVPRPGHIRTTLDLALQRRAEAIVKSHRARLLKSGASQAAAVILQNPSMEVLALVGSFAYGPRDGGFNNGASAWRSPGSTLKPFLYGQALDQGFTAASVLEDVEKRYRTPRGEFIPANFDRWSHGPITLREALGNSLNLAAVHLLNLIGPDSYFETLTSLRLINHRELAPEYYGLGLVVGNPEVSLLQLAAAYSCLANGGLFRPARLLPDEPQEEPVRVFSPEAAYLISDILSDPMARARIFGGSLAMNPPYRMALKTGTSTRYRDCWAVAYTPEYTLAVWVGNFDGRPTANLSGAAAAAPILADLAAELFAPGPPQPFQKPQGVVAATICAFSGQKPGPGCGHRRQELFLAGTEPTEICAYHHRQEPWHRMPTPYAGWLHQRFATGGEGRFRLADFDQDLGKTFGQPDVFPKENSLTPRGSGGKLTLGLAGPSGPGGLAPTMVDEMEPQISISYPLDRDRYLLPPQEETLRLTLKAVCREPLRAVTWFVDGREVAAVGPPYEVTLELSRGCHRFTVVGQDCLGDSVEVVVQ